MQIKLRTIHGKHISRTESEVEIKEVMIAENIFNPSGEAITLGFQNGPVSGLLTFSQKEFDKLVSDVKKHSHLIKGIKYFK